MNADVEILKFDIHNEMDVMLAHRRAMQFAKFSGFSLAEQTRFATAVSEICRNTLEHAERGFILFTIRKNAGEFALEAVIRDEGSGIRDLEQILTRTPETHRGRGLGIVYARRLVDNFQIVSNDQGTTVVLKKAIPSKTDTFTKLVINGWLKHLANEPAISAYEELKMRNLQLLEMTEELTKNSHMVEKQILEIRQLNLQLSENNARMKEFTYAISHDLKNPLSSLKIAAEQLGRRPGGEEANVFHGVLTRSVNRLDKTIHSLIEILDIQNQTKYVSREIEFKRLLAETEDEYAQVIAETGTVVESDFLSAPRITYIEGYLQSLFHNLISNSLKYRHPEHSPVISVKTAKIKTGIRLEFRDNGIGMDLPKVKDRLFQPFSRLSNSPDGKGIGLYLIKGMVESNGGSVGVNSKPGEGTTFVFDLISYA